MAFSPFHKLLKNISFLFAIENYEMKFKKILTIVQIYLI